MKVKLPQMTCPYEDCQFLWHPRVENPKKCPRCQRRLDRRVQLLKRGNYKLANKEQAVEGGPDFVPKNHPSIGRSIIESVGEDITGRSIVSEQEVDNYIANEAIDQQLDKEDEVSVGT